MTDPVLAALQAAAARFQAGDFAGALGGAEDALRRRPGDAEGLHLKALALARLGRLDEAIPTYEAASKLHPQRHAVLSNLGNALAAAGRNAEAVGAYRAAVTAAPGFANGWYNLAAALKAGGDLDGAVAALRTAVRLEPKNARAANNLGSALHDKGELGAALDAFTASIEADPRFAPAYVNRGKLLRERSDIAAARADHERAAALAPDLAEAHYQLGCSRRLSGDIDAAAAAYRRAISLFPQSVAAQRDLANMLWEAGKPGEFLATLDATIAVAPSAELLSLKAELAGLAGDSAGAAEAARRLIAVAPSDPRGYARLSRTLRGEGRFTDAAAVAARGHAADPDDFAALHEYAEALLSINDPRTARTILDRDAPPEHLQRHIALRATAMRAAGDPDYRRFYDYERFAAKLFIDPPQGYADVASFNDALAAALLPLHEGKSERPIDQTLYGGTQSFGSLWDEPHPAIQALRETLMALARRYVAALPDDPDHPFLRRKSFELECAGSWSVVLKSGGGHVDHYHPKGWISASYYVRVPPEIAAGEKPGFLRLGAWRGGALDLPAERWFRPEEGSAIFFPSYMWHGVEPFLSDRPRITAPFDLAPRSGPR